MKNYMLVSEKLNGFNVVCRQVIDIYDSGYQNCCNLSRFKLGFKVPAHQRTMQKIKMIPHPFTLN